jgi:signal peptidase II
MTKKLYVLLGLGGFTILLDLFSKELVSRVFSLGRSLDVIDGILRITYIHNRGAIFGLSIGESTGTLVLAVSLLAVVLITIYYFRLPLKLKWYGIGLVLILSGAVGNLYDRIAIGEVRDFIDIGINGLRWPIFNVADLAVTTGAVLLAIELFQKEKIQETSEVSAE